MYNNIKDTWSFHHEIRNSFSNFLKYKELNEDELEVFEKMARKIQAKSLLTHT